MKKTKIIATIGPASEAPEMLEALMKSGANVFRLNFSHGDHAEQGARIVNIRAISKKLGLHVAILVDLQGPKIRIGEYDGFLHKNELVTLSCDDKLSENEIPVQYKNLYKDVKAGDRLLLDDGLLELKVHKIEGRNIVCKVIIGGKLTSKKGINLPTGSISAKVVTEKDNKDAIFALSQGVDFLALSFVREAADVVELKELISKSKNPKALVVAKIERHEAIKNFEDILEAANAIMIARGDMGIEIDQQKVPLIQKHIIKRCLAVGRPSIVATQMLDSMIRNPRSTRAETSDIANAILDGTDAVMLSGETANGKYPLQAVKAMNKIAIHTESWVAEQGMTIGRSVKRDTHKITEAIAKSAVTLAQETQSRYIIAGTTSGRTARSVAKFRPNEGIIACTDSEVTARRLALTWGVWPFVIEYENNKKLLLKISDKLKALQLLKTGDILTLISGLTKGKVGGTSIIRIFEVE